MDADVNEAPGSCVVRAWVIRLKRYVLSADDDTKLRYGVRETTDVNQ